MNSNIVFLDWLKNRLIYKHGYSIDNDILVKLDCVKEDIEPKKINISNQDLDKILIKYYADFDLDYTDDLRLGFTNNDRDKLRNSIRLIVDEINRFIASQK